MRHSFTAHANRQTEGGRSPARRDNGTLGRPGASVQAPSSIVSRYVQEPEPRSLGNHATLRRMAQQAAAPMKMTETLFVPFLQRRLSVGAANDPLEHEAERVAEHVIRLPDRTDAVSAAAPRISRKCAACEDADRIPLRAKVVGSDRPQGAAPPLVDEVIGSSGQPLDPAARRFMEPRFGRDFSGVRVHADSAAGASCQALNALAYTVGDHLVFGHGRYRPDVMAGRELLAHELTHVVQQESAHAVPRAAAPRGDTSLGGGSVVQRQTSAAEEDAPAGQFVATDAGTADAGAGQGESTQADAGQGAATQAGAVPGAPLRICGPDITTPLTTMLGTVEPWFKGLTSFQQLRSCVALGPGGFLVGVNPGMAWDTRELFLPNTGWLDPYFRRSSCGSPRDPGCDTDPQRHLCETAGTCGNSVVVDSKCMLAGTANYALFGKMCRLCHDYQGRWNRWDMRATIGAWKTIDWDDSTPPKEVASAAYDGTFPKLPAAAENRGSCTGRCDVAHAGTFDFIWEPYRPR